ncbi:MAG: hypothetical protein NWQ00_00740 [Burkholderiaceae bacterium]|nr:hypothetical protein [Burkholderiaceae bacterium]MDP4968906.1 hypothetical protein [Burkholderiaceae bacterium]MDP5110949.1 hypothetical protein [Burkholderiaceae bacterium]
MTPSRTSGSPTTEQQFPLVFAIRDAQGLKTMAHTLVNLAT